MNQNDNLKTFLDANPFSKIENDDKSLRVINPWNDESIYFEFDLTEIEEVSRILNNLILPQRFTALYHRTNKEIEFIYSLLDKDNLLVGRSFEYTFCTKTYACSFEVASTELMYLSRFYKQSGIQPTHEYRNLPLLSSFSKLKKVEEETLSHIPNFRDLLPISFFIKGIDIWDDEELINLSKHLNFLIKYYDRKSPIILIHPEIVKDDDPIKQLQFINNEFPTKLTICKKNNFLIDLLLAANNIDLRLQFIYYYQILEYSAFYYSDTELSKKLFLILKDPCLQANIENTILKIIETMVSVKLTDEAKLNKIVEQYCNPEIIWSEIKENFTSFLTVTVFDGGFTLANLINQDATLETFKQTWFPKTPDYIRKIRNALVHSRESRQDYLISPSKINDNKIRPWLNVLRRVAEQVVLYSDC